ncbi:MAG: 1-(5-phosphoribosyl)-5-[(5-phosphoribosylamino)methylideneamino]imidazole-4-carboxamide isomerase [Phycisphaerales bacterium]|nr:1-(5-phosphoribosyl)-5-[(5-phosphoribosylamino)methylideneamino]imidazole-4-carboxamide isomerase [Phycisphaerales bacterium]
MFQVVPSIDLRAGKVVRLQQGDYARQLDYDLDPVQTTLGFERAGAQWMHIVDLDGAKQGQPQQLDLIARIIASTKMKVQVGGGIRQTQDIQNLLDRGAQRVVVGTAAMENWSWFQELAHSQPFENRLVLALDAKAGLVATRGWTQTTSQRAVDVAKLVSHWPLGAILYTDVARDGMMQGPNISNTVELAKVGDIPVIASGGVRDLDHIASLLNIGVWGVIVGRSLHERTLDLHQAIQLASQSAQK